MKKKIIAIVLCGVIAVGLIGCGSSSDSDTEEQTSETEEQTSEAATQTNEAAEQTVSDAQPDEDATKALEEYIAGGYEIPSRQDFIDQLVYVDGYSEDVAKATVDAYDYDWNSLAAEYVNWYTDGYDERDDILFDPNTCIELLEDEGYTTDEIDYAIANADIDWNMYAVRWAKRLLEESPDRDRDNIITNLEDEGFTTEQAEYGADNCN